MNRKPSKKALLVGINAYLPPNTLLHGCINDTAQIKEILTQRYDFDGEQIRLLLDANATRQNILDDLDWLVSSAQPGDVLVFAYSGHGSQVDDDSGDEWECRDEILIPYDHSWDNPLRDDDLKKKFDKVPLGANLTFICDSCHSGTVNKDITEMEVPRVVFVPPEIQRRIAVKVAKRNEDYKAYARDEFRHLSKDLPPSELDAKIDEFLSSTLQTFKQNRFQFVKTEENNFLLAACQDVETSTDACIEGEWHGAFTYHLVKALIEGADGLTYDKLIKMAAQGLARYQQTPQLECLDLLRNLSVFGSLPTKESTS